ncbi:hypothetical protein [Nonomuraea basaltis]|uniref:hypothetical protein n=1 Tax=Nonomuraea basaltis TaxID=2495887 RepID=UPI0014871064|nr:hypothetical protein [Nonomuraea basaltis]
MKFALLLFDPENYWESISKEEMGAALAEHAAFAQYLRERGVVFSGEALMDRPGNLGGYDSCELTNDVANSCAL